MATRIAAPTRTVRLAGRGLAWVLVCGAAIGCTASGSDVQLLRDQLSFPTGLKVARLRSAPAGQADTPDNYVLFVVNANSELRSDSGSIDVVDLGRVQDVIGKWLDHLKKPDGMDCTESFAKPLSSDHPAADDGGSALSCTCDVGNATTLQCEEAYFIRRGASVRVGNFATDLSVQDFSAGGVTHLRVFAPTRGDPSIAWADFDGTSLQCADGPQAYPLCDDAHRLTSLNNDPNLEALPNEPFAVFSDVVRGVDPAGNPVDPTHGFAMVTHLASGAVTLIDAPASGEVRVTDVLNGVFGDPSIAARGATSVAGLPMTPVPPPASPAPGEGVPEVVPEVLYVASDTDNRVQLFNVGMRAGAAAYLVPDTFFVLNAVGTTSNGSTDSRGIRFSADGKRLYLVNRTPPSIQVYDTSIGPAGTPNNTLLGASDLCREGSAAAVAGAGTDERVYITCFQEGQIYAVNPFGQSQVEDIITVGRGPYAADVLSTLDTQSATPMPPRPRYLFVTNVLEDTIAVIDIDPSSPTRDRVVLRIGTPRAP
jgi:DNA-binding beta-propeller fold protein YncE